MCNLQWEQVRAGLLKLLSPLVVNVGDYHGYLRLEALTVRGRAGEACPLAAQSHMAVSAFWGRVFLGNIGAWPREAILPGSADPCIINHYVSGGL